MKTTNLNDCSIIGVLRDISGRISYEVSNGIVEDPHSKNEIEEVRILIERGGNEEEFVIPPIKEGDTCYDPVVILGETENFRFVAKTDNEQSPVNYGVIGRENKDKSVNICGFRERL